MVITTSPSVTISDQHFGRLLDVLGEADILMPVGLDAVTQY